MQARVYSWPLSFGTPCRSVQGLGPCADAPRVCGPGGRACTASKGRDEPGQGRGPADAARAACRGRQCRAGRNGGRGAGVAGMPARAASLRQMDRADFFFLPLKAAPGRESALFCTLLLPSPREKKKAAAPEAAATGQHQPHGERSAGFAARPHPTKGQSLHQGGAAERRRGMVRRRAERRPPGRREARGNADATREPAST